jgi:hypothetical protein
VTGKRELVLFLPLLLLTSIPARVDALIPYSGVGFELGFRLPCEDPGLGFFLPAIAFEKGVHTTKYAPLDQSLEVSVAAGTNLLSFYAGAEVVGKTIVRPSFLSHRTFDAVGLEYGVGTLFWIRPLWPPFHDDFDYRSGNVLTARAGIVHEAGYFESDSYVYISWGVQFFNIPDPWAWAAYISVSLTGDYW